ncbi:hypothetical protein L5515_007100 [Caenorhabditis briggsae]|uniref:Uncharacterized protein n=1 Tax=Caenorhabditis briggsae TaxID=6238 RepID=A0AAE9F3P3_CAEBR|nr:hypothetical protein L5515_007100 [Caenorhabditis briggsae]
MGQKSRPRAYLKFWHSFTRLTVGCDDLEAYKALDIRTAENQDEIKYEAFPHQDEILTMVTLEIGHDVNAELKLKEVYPNIAELRWHKLCGRPVSFMTAHDSY